LPQGSDRPGEDLPDSRQNGAVISVSPAQFEELVAHALERVPLELARLVDNVVFVIEAEAPPDDPDLLGLYEGVPHTERSGAEGPDVVSIFRLALCDACDDLDELTREVRITVIHELAHAAGIDDDRLHDLGWG